ncbi:fatty acid-binding protein-like [Glandiceps talaboti]
MAFSGNWKFVKSDNMDKFLLAAGAPADVAQKAETFVTTLKCSKDGDYFVIAITGPQGNTVEQRFKPGEPFTESVGPIGKERTAVAIIGDDGLVIKGVDEGSVAEIRKITPSGDEMITIFSKPDVDEVGKRFFKRV